MFGEYSTERLCAPLRIEDGKSRIEDRGLKDGVLKFGISKKMKNGK